MDSWLYGKPPQDMQALTLNTTFQVVIKEGLSLILFGLGLNPLACRPFSAHVRFSSNPTLWPLFAVWVHGHDRLTLSQNTFLQPGKTRCVRS